MDDGTARPWSGFMQPEEESLAARFLACGHVIVPAEDGEAVRCIRDQAAALAARHLGCAPSDDSGRFLETIHERVPVARLNDLRLAVFDGLNTLPWLRPAYFAAARRTLEVLVGNELAMQLRVNLSIQLPGDDSSLLPLHADVFNGDSPFEVVVWLPLVDCYGTKSMFFLPPIPNQRLLDDFATQAGRSAEDLYRQVEPDLLWLTVKFGQVLVFSQNLMHGNRINREPDTRWSMNCRFKSVFSPYADKKLGEFFEPVTLRPATRLGAAFTMPGGFGE